MSIPRGCFPLLPPYSVARLMAANAKNRRNRPASLKSSERQARRVLHVWLARPYPSPEDQRRSDRLLAEQLLQCPDFQALACAATYTFRANSDNRSSRSPAPSANTRFDISRSSAISQPLMPFPSSAWPSVLPRLYLGSPAQVGYRPFSNSLGSIQRRSGHGVLSTHGQRNQASFRGDGSPDHEAVRADGRENLRRGDQAVVGLSRLVLDL